MSKKSRDKKHKKAAKAHVIGKIKPEIVQALPVVEDPKEVADESHYVVAVPKSLWQKIKEWLKGS
jgi:hypothetical protein